MNILQILFSLINTVILIALLIFIVYLLRLLIKVLKKYLRSNLTTDHSIQIKLSLGEAIKKHRLERKMTQEFVAEALNVSRQAVSKWESGASDPSTSNLIAIAKLFNISPEELLKNLI